MQDQQAIRLFFDDIRQKCPTITEAELLQFATKLTVQRLNTRAFYRNAEKVPPQLGFIAGGLVKGFYIDINGEPNNIYFGAEGDPVGDYLAFVHQIPSAYAIQTLEPTIVVNLTFADFERSLVQFPSLERYYRLLAETGFYNYLQRTADLQSVSAEERYLQFLRQKPRLAERISVSDLSSYLGIKRQSLTRIRKKLRETA
ncbi:Crp/Fnr family transcriptional regulator [Pasteurellaceae bacterium LIM206]|nr:Crp/Fnr family transcriptional regulator [Pasteurellaceae bacterium LIM206]